ncbi:hypothetical protein OIU77_010441 [Salix suchowensis]|uniref:Uncharacterized protein n=1 Tax=Salix suchowensis TaxID=1278906 RepID=A0ABQ9A9G8_9ROSI|nr:hypothetical protein OIU77_010441 [Salix suchowensis]
MDWRRALDSIGGRRQGNRAHQPSLVIDHFYWVSKAWYDEPPKQPQRFAANCPPAKRRATGPGASIGWRNLSPGPIFSCCLSASFSDRLRRTSIVWIRFPKTYLISSLSNFQRRQ